MTGSLPGSPCILSRSGKGAGCNSYRVLMGTLRVLGPSEGRELQSSACAAQAEGQREPRAAEDKKVESN